MVRLSILTRSFQTRLANGHLSDFEKRVLEFPFSVVGFVVFLVTVTFVLYRFYSRPYVAEDDYQVRPALFTIGGAGWQVAKVVDISYAARLNPQFYVWAVGMSVSCILAGVAMLLAREVSCSLPTFRSVGLHNAYFTCTWIFVVCGVIMACCRSTRRHPNLDNVHQSAAAVCMVSLWVCAVLHERIQWKESPNTFVWPQLFVLCLTPCFLLVWLGTNPVLFPGQERQSWAEWLMILCLFRHPLSIRSEIPSTHPLLQDGETKVKPSSQCRLCTLPIWGIFLPGVTMQVASVVYVLSAYSTNYLNQAPYYHKEFPPLCIMAEEVPELHTVFLFGCLIMSIAVLPLDLALAGLVASRRCLSAAMTILAAISFVLFVAFVLIQQEPLHTNLVNVCIWVRGTLAALTLAGLRDGRRLFLCRVTSAMLLAVLAVAVGVAGIVDTLRGPLVVLELALIPTYCLWLASFLGDVRGFRVAFGFCSAELVGCSTLEQIPDDQEGESHDAAQDSCSSGSESTA
eukprot:TRINITY_DN29402_c0_g1_i1.p1 TRINITY_DN29402_c0_g1~~TRINITY_DN29402_c0_g1_i1.p1  ORF type:complete len:536 (+),score=52.57 TRINITY_DN29402_c0_g1_i1:71-1609(+)